METRSEWLSPGARTLPSYPTLQFSTQTIPRYSRSPKSGILRDLSIQGFQTTPVSLFSLEIRMLRPMTGSLMTASPGQWQ